MSFLNEINDISAVQVEQKPTVKLQELEVGKKFKILNVKAVKGKFGESILVELEDCITFLPNRCTDVYKEHIKEFKKGVYFLEFIGLQELPKGFKPRILFKITN